jgi:hypothetical protein
MMTRHLTHSLTHAQVRALAVVRAHGPGRERGDVPGWVLITLMTAGLVAVLWGVAQNQLQALFTRAMNSVTGP